MDKPKDFGGFSRKELNRHVKILYGYPDIRGKKSEAADLLSEIQGINLRDFARMTSELGILLGNESHWPLTKKLASTFFNKNDVETFASQLVKRGGREGILFHERPLALLLEIGRHVCSNDLPDLDRELLLKKFGTLILLANDLSSTYDHNAKLTPSTFARFAIREYIFNHRDQFRTAMARSYLVFDILWDKLELDKNLKPSNLFLDTLGFSFEDFQLVVLAIYSYWGTQTVENWDPSHGVIDPKKLFPATLVNDRLAKVLEYLSQEWRIPNSNSPTSIVDSACKAQYLQFSLKQKPLLKTEGVFLCSFFRFIEDLAWNGPYYLLLDKIKDRPLKQNVLNGLGKTSEDYATSLLKWAFPRKFKKVFTPLGNELGEGCLEMRKNWLIMFEVKSSRPNADVYESNFDLKNSDTFQKLIFDPLKQVSDRIQEYRQSNNDIRITPFILLGGYFPFTSSIWKEIEDKVKHLFIFNDPNTDFPIFCEPSSFETLLSQVQAGVAQIGALVRDKVNANWRHEDMNTFLSHFKLSTSGTDPYHPVMKSLQDSVWHKLVQDLGIPSNHFEPKDGEFWKDVFQLRSK